MVEQDIQQNSNLSTPAEEKKSKHPILKKVAISVVALVGLLLIVQKISMYRFEKAMQENFVNTNSQLTGQNVTIDSVTTSVLTSTTQIYRVTVYNPSGYISPYAFNSAQVELITNLNLDKNNPYWIVPQIVFKEVVINYDMNSKSYVNLYQIIDNITKSVAPDERFSALSVLDTANTPLNQPLKYNGAKFKIDKIILEKPTVNIFNNRRLIKSIAVNTIEITNDKLQQPTDYANVLLAATIRIMGQLDNAVLK